MTVRITSMNDAEHGTAIADAEARLGTLHAERGSLPLERVDVRVEITGLTSEVELTQDFINAFDVPLEATYVFPLPDRAAVTRMRMTVNGRAVEAELVEREAARRAYDGIIVSDRRAAIVEEERPDVFTMRVGNILPSERVSVALTLVNPLTYQDGAATFRFPLVVAPRYIPGAPLADGAVGDGYAADTDAVPDASRITPPMLLPGFPYPLLPTIDIGIDPAGLSLSEVRSNLPAVSTDDGRIKVQPGGRANQDFVLRLRYGAEDLTDSLVLVPDADGDEGTYQLTVLPPASGAPPRPRDVVLLLDRSRSMAGWKMAAARRTAARIVDTLGSADRFAVLTFGDLIEHPAGLPDGLVDASDRHRYRAIEHLARVDARGDTELLAPLRQGLALLRGSQGRDAVLVVVTDGQVGNEDQVLRELSHGLQQVRVHAVGIDRAVNAGFLHRLVRLGAGHCELVESEDRLDEALQAVRRRIGAPLAHSLTLHTQGLNVIADTVSPVRLPELVAGVPVVVTGRYRGSATGSLILRGTTGDGGDWSATVDGQRRESPVVTAGWARAHLRDLEDRYAAAATDELEKRIVDTSLRFRVLCRFTGYVVACENRDNSDSPVAAEGEVRHRVMQPVEAPAGWERWPAGDDAGNPQRGAPRSRGSAAEAPSGAVPSAFARTIKLRNAIAVAIAGVVLVCLGWAWSLTRDGLPVTARDSGVAGKPSATADATVPGTKGGIAENTVAAPEAPPLPHTPPDGTYKRDIVTTGSLQLVVAQPAQVADRLALSVTDAGGRVDSRSEQSGLSSPTVHLVVRIPADRLDALLVDVKKLGAVTSMSISHADVTSQRVDLDARIEALQTSVNRLLELMRRADNTADLLAAESSLTQRQAELDSLRAQRAALGDQISYATINVSLSVEPTVTRVGFLGALERGWHSVLSAAYGVMLTAGFLLPWLPVLAVLVLAVVVVLRRWSFPRASGAAGSPTTNC
ncbi:DUF4349 domain-containing protein [Mycobacterium attenuatum]|uniref:DUF4349 domain-containing protein n=1 Tax=Mycobacterium attenuatum TaxID=2341086 RepID=UPI000F03528E|nr:DUF4349 domain-containing protein [Mycobacterium attenuatum]VBA59691.1 hypothetical protein LAUMK41_03622 [Mycobacterium attenuatum]